MTRHRTESWLFVVFGALTAACMLAVPIQSQGPDGSHGLQVGLYKGHEVAAGEVLVKLHEHARVAPMPGDLDADRDEPIGDGTVRRIHSRSHDVDTLLARLAVSPDVEYAEPNYVLYALDVPNDPAYPEDLWGIVKISAQAAWDQQWTGTTDNVVAVVDTGIDYTHPDLAPNVWTAPPGYSVTVGGVTCGAGTHGFNAITKTCNPMDDNGHGTHVSGTIGAKGNNGIGVVGVNWTARIVGLKFLNRQGSGTTADAIDAIEYAIQAARAGVDIRVLSNSWGGGAFSQSLLDEIITANGEGMVFVAAAGNNGRNIDQSPSYPASYDAPNVVAVAATDANDSLASWSNYGVSNVDLAAPGVDIYSTLRGSKYGLMSGTSMATPHVSGAAALVLSACGSLDPAELKSVLVGYSDPVVGLQGKVATGGRLNVMSAVTRCGIVPEPPPPAPDFSMAAAPPSQTVPRGTTATYAVTISRLNDFAGDVTLTVTGVPAGATSAFVPSDAVVRYPASTATLNVTPGPSTKTSGWAYNMKITGTSGGLVHSTTVRISATR